MALNKYRLGDLIEPVDERNENNAFTENDVRGISTSKQFINTKADLNGVRLTNYKVVRKGYFAYVSDTSRRGDKIALAYCDRNCIISSIYTVFKISRPDIINANYLYMYFNRPEFDRYSRFNSWGSARETFSWEDMCDAEINLPDLPIQEKYANIYLSMLDNKKNYEKGLSDLKLVCDGYIENLRRKTPSKKIGKYIKETNLKNSDNLIKNVMGLSTTKQFREAQSRVNKEELDKYKVVKSNEFAFVPTTDTWKVLAFALNTYEYPIVVSPIYVTFKIEDKIIPEYLAMWLSRKEFDRYARFNSWGSARENFSFSDMENVLIPIPEIDIQKSIVNIYKVYKQRKNINDNLNEQIKNICPILIKGSIEEGQREA